MSKLEQMEKTIIDVIEAKIRTLDDDEAGDLYRRIIAHCDTQIESEDDNPLDDDDEFDDEDGDE